MNYSLFGGVVHAIEVITGGRQVSGIQRPPGDVARTVARALAVCFLFLFMGCSDDPAAPAATPAEPTAHEPSNTPIAGVDPGTPAEPDKPPAFLGQACTEHTDCIDKENDITGYCAATHPSGAKTCTIGCEEECPDGYGCNAVANVSGSDTLFLCIPNPNVSCIACTVNANCIYENARCLDVASSGEAPDFRCAYECLLHSDCDEGYECLPVGDAQAAGFCVPKSGSCTCTGMETAPVEAEPCVNTNVHGTCTGTQTCAENGGWICDAPAPEAETCDGKDNNCDGEVDEGCPMTRVVLQLGAAVLKSPDNAQDTIRITVSPLGPVGHSLPEDSGFGVSWGFYNAIK